MKIVFHSTTNYYIPYLNRLIKEIKPHMPMTDFRIISRHIDRDQWMMRSEAMNSNLIVTCGWNHEGSRFCPQAIADDVGAKLVSITHSVAPPKYSIENCIFERGTMMLPRGWAGVVLHDKQSIYPGGHWMLAGAKRTILTDKHTAAIGVADESIDQIMALVEKLQSEGKLVVIRPHPGIFAPNGNKGRTKPLLDKSDIWALQNEGLLLTENIWECNEYYSSYQSSLAGEWAYATCNIPLDFNRQPLYNWNTWQVRAITDFAPVSFSSTLRSLM